jgi:hypothetical protein
LVAEPDRTPEPDSPPILAVVNTGDPLSDHTNTEQVLTAVWKELLMLAAVKVPDCVAVDDVKTKFWSELRFRRAGVRFFTQYLIGMILAGW